MSRTILLRHGQSLYNAGETDDFDSDVTERAIIKSKTQPYTLKR